MAKRQAAASASASPDRKVPKTKPGAQAPAASAASQAPAASPPATDAAPAASQAPKAATPKNPAAISPQDAVPVAKLQSTPSDSSLGAGRNQDDQVLPVPKIDEKVMLPNLTAIIPYVRGQLRNVLRTRLELNVQFSDCPFSFTCLWKSKIRAK